MTGLPEQQFNKCNVCFSGVLALVMEYGLHLIKIYKQRVDITIYNLLNRNQE